MKVKETDLVKQILDYLALRGVFAWRQNQGAMKGTYSGTGKKWFLRFAGAKGISDVIGVLEPEGRFLAIEAKVKPNKPTDDQTAFLERVRECGGVGILAYDLDDVRSVFRDLGIE